MLFWWALMNARDLISDPVQKPFQLAKPRLGAVTQNFFLLNRAQEATNDEPELAALHGRLEREFVTVLDHSSQQP